MPISTKVHNVQSPYLFVSFKGFVSRFSVVFQNFLINSNYQTGEMTIRNWSIELFVFTLTVKQIFASLRCEFIDYNVRKQLQISANTRKKTNYLHDV